MKCGENLIQKIIEIMKTTEDEFFKDFVLRFYKKLVF